MAEIRSLVEADSAVTKSLLAALVQLLLGVAVAMLVGQLLMMAVMMPMLAGATYTAWMQMFGQPAGEAGVAKAVPGQLEA